MLTIARSATRGIGARLCLTVAVRRRAREARSTRRCCGCVARACCCCCRTWDRPTTSRCDLYPVLRRTGESPRAANVFDDRDGPPPNTTFVVLAQPSSILLDRPTPEYPQEMRDAIPWTYRRQSLYYEGVTRALWRVGSNTLGDPGLSLSCAVWRRPVKPQGTLLQDACF